ncbi:MAG: NifB/NifX family molybdenum-iron cluster-binding protein [Planctomycetes bacterium]|nr:NifB/NifX family molybdenum-iron cluster-binding protein [Planctomycetota bacterium]
MSAKKLIVVSSEDNNGLEGNVSGHFGGCPFFTLIEVENNEIKEHLVVENPHFQLHQPGIIPEYIKSLDTNVIISGGMGARAQKLFNQFGIEPVTGASGKIEDNVKAYLANKLKGAEPCRHNEHGCGHDH